MNRARARRRVIKDVSEISPLIKYLLFGFNVIFWVSLKRITRNFIYLKIKKLNSFKLLGFLIFGIGIYAWIEKDTFTRLSSLSIGILFDPAFIFLVIGLMVFIIGFCGCVGALRENTLLLLLVSAFKLVILISINELISIYIYIIF